MKTFVFVFKFFKNMNTVKFTVSCQGDKENVQQYNFSKECFLSVKNPVEKIDNFINWGYLISLQQEISFVSSPPIKSFNRKTNLSKFLVL